MYQELIPIYKKHLDDLLQNCEGKKKKKPDTQTKEKKKQTNKHKKPKPLSVIKLSLNTFWDVPVVEELPFYDTQFGGNCSSQGHIE